MKFNSDDRNALIGTILVHAVLLLILSFTILRTIVPDEDGGILVNFGDVVASAGAFESQQTVPLMESEPVPPPTEATPPIPQEQERAKEELITQKEEATVKLPEKKKKEVKKEPEKVLEKPPLDKQKEDATKQRIAEEKRKREEEAARKQQQQATDISNRVSGAFGKSNTQRASDNQGNTTSTTGNQGNPFGNSDSGSTEGVGGAGSFNLSGRTLGSGGLPRPAYSVQEEGTIVIDITVNPNGDVVDARIGRGTNIDNASLRNSAIDAAKRAKFNRIQGTNNQSGTITYRYKFN